MAIDVEGKSLDQENLHDKMRKECWDRAVDTWGKAYIYKRRLQRVRRSIGFITFLGIVSPLIVGAVVVNYGAGSSATSLALGVLAPLSILQLVVSVWAIVDKWSAKSEYYAETVAANGALAEDYTALAKFPPVADSELKAQMDRLNIHCSIRDSQDTQHALSEKENHRAMRAALRQYQRRCVSCKIVPVSMLNSDCPVCGKF